MLLAGGAVDQRVLRAADVRLTVTVIVATYEPEVIRRAPESSHSAGRATR